MTTVIQEECACAESVSISYALKRVCLVPHPEFDKQSDLAELTRAPFPFELASRKRKREPDPESEKLGKVEVTHLMG